MKVVCDLKHNWRGMSWVDGWYLMWCLRCGHLVLHRFDGRKA